MATIKGPFVTGQELVFANLKVANTAINAGLSRGLRLAGLALQAESQLIVPVEFGNLKASAFTRAQGAGGDTVVSVGYTALYALFVHENVAMKLKGEERRPSPPHIGRYWDPAGRGQAKFLEQPFRASVNRTVDLVMKEIRKEIAK
jgi:hypothetical protein